MSETNRRDDLLEAVALTEFSVHYEDVDPELSRRAWQDRLLRFTIVSAPCFCNSLEDSVCDENSE
ncbi:hypothetical protein [Haloterrigena salinisoli]|uniref:hypothetical protein n=1 Tax=Haloterrigena salinisoli TaxID=3132747 RepID=UPI0030D38031